MSKSDFYVILGVQFVVLAKLEQGSFWGVAFTVASILALVIAYLERKL